MGRFVTDIFVLLG